MKTKNIVFAQPMTLLQFLMEGRIKAGQRITTQSDSGEIKSFWVGHATEYHKPSETDADIGWDYSDAFMEDTVMSVLEVED